jgi:hypothetical protein
MATSFTNTPIAHTNDAEFRAWGSEVSGQLSSVGTTSSCLTQTADTGQINWVTVNRPGTNTAAGYEIWQLTDSLGVSAPIYLKIEYGTASTNQPGMWITVGTGTNGAGTLTGSTSTRMAWHQGSTPGSTVLSYPNYVSNEEGHVGVFLKGGSASSSTRPMGFFAVERPCDPDGTMRSDGIVVYVWNNSTLGAETVNLATGVKYGSATNKSFCMVPNEITSTAVGSDINAFKHYTAYPAIHSLNGLCTVLGNEMGFGTSDTATLNGATPHTYVQLGSDSNPINITTAAVANETSTGRRGLCMLWE